MTHHSRARQGFFLVRRHRHRLPALFRTQLLLKDPHAHWMSLPSFQT